MFSGENTDTAVARRKHAVPRFARQAALFAVPVFLLCFLGGCAGRTSTETIRSSMASDDMSGLEKNLEETHESYGEMVTALNLARVYQLEGRWRASIKAFEEALALLEDYENRAIINMRGLASSAGTIFLSKGADEYFGTGFERSLLHTFNALNYMMLGDFSGAAVEIRRMDQRQALWLEESQSRIEKHIEEKGESSPDGLPHGYSMREVLRDESVRRLLNNYQDPFSYALGTVFYRLAEDFQAAEVSMRRAMALDGNAERLFTDAWPSENDGKAKAGDAAPTVPRLPFNPLTGEAAIDRKNPEIPDTQEVTLIAFTGLAPALGIENVRIWFPAIGYILIDLPAYKGAVRGTKPRARAADVITPVVFYPLLRTDLLAYRTLLDEIRPELGLAASRALTRAGVAAGAYVAASSNEDTRAYAPLISQLTTVILDLFATSMAGSVRSWETLPNTGYLAMTRIPRGSTLVVGFGKGERLIHLPRDARGVIVMATELSNTNLKVNHVTY